MKDTHNFKSDGISYEMFISSDKTEEYYELYEKENPKQGLIFESKKQLIGFINYLTDIIEEEVITE